MRQAAGPGTGTVAAALRATLARLFPCSQDSQAAPPWVPPITAPPIRCWSAVSFSPIRWPCASWGRTPKRLSVMRKTTRPDEGCACSLPSERALPKMLWRPPSQRGVRQLVVLGAGLDTYAYRTTLGESLRIFEVDHPATQAWKRQRLAEAAIPVPRALTFAPVDFERETLADGLTAAGFDPVATDLFHLAGRRALSDGAGRLFDAWFHRQPAGGCSRRVRLWQSPASSSDQDEYAAVRERLAARVASLGEAFRSAF